MSSHAFSVFLVAQGSVATLIRLCCAALVKTLRMFERSLSLAGKVKRRSYPSVCGASVSILSFEPTDL